MDKHITCRDCRIAFLFTDGEQTFYESKGFKPPARCKACRSAKKAAQDSKEDK